MEDAAQQLIQANAWRVQERIAAAARSVGRDAEEVRLVVVTKGHPLSLVQAAVQAGLRVFGENYAEEGAAKIAGCGEHAGLEWHMIGHVQSRKALLVSQNFAWMHSLDSLKLAQRLDRFCGEVGRRMPVLLECNVSGEESKYGWQAWQEAEWGRLRDEIAPLLELPALEVRGLMTMAPYYDEPELARPTFRQLRRLQGYLREQLPAAGWDELSMGMSGDFEAAVQEGATLVRVGTAIVGPRPCAL